VSDGKLPPIHISKKKPRQEEQNIASYSAGKNKAKHANNNLNIIMDNTNGRPSFSSSFRRDLNDIVLMDNEMVPASPMVVHPHVQDHVQSKNNEENNESIKNEQEGSVSNTAFDESSASSVIIEKKTKCSRCLHLLCSINVLFTIVIVVALIVSIVTVLLSCLLTSRDIILDLGSNYRQTLTLQSKVSLTNMLQTSTQSMNLTLQLLRRTYNYMNDMFDSADDVTRVSNIFRSIVISDPYILEANLFFNDGSCVMAIYEPPNYVVYTESANTNYTAIVKTFNSSITNTPENVTLIPDWNQFVLNSSLRNLAQNSYNISKNMWSISAPFTTIFQQVRAYALSTQLYNEQGVTYGSLITVYNISKIEEQLQTSQGYILITDTNGSFITCTLPYAKITQTLEGNSSYVPLSMTKNNELILFEDAIQNSYGGWDHIANDDRFNYNSPQLGSIIVRKVSVSFPNTEWYIFAAWPETVWTNKLHLTVGIAIAISIIILLTSTICTLSLSIRITLSINKIKNCFDRVRRMDLESPYLDAALKSNYLWYEPWELQSSFRSMLYTLRSFQHYVPTFVVQRLLFKGTEASLGLHSKICTVFFLNIKDFAKLSDQLQADVLVDMIGEIFERLSTIIQQPPYFGTIDKYIGDSIMAYFEDEGHENRACSCALACKTAMLEFSKSLSNSESVALECCIGINSGRVLMGNFGSKSRFNWTVLGDTVNLAARVLSLNKYYNSGILITMATANKLREDTFVLRKVERVKVKGKQKSAIIWELLKESDKLISTEYSSLEIYQKAFNLYMVGKFNEARELFQSIEGYESDPVIRKKISQCEQYQEDIITKWNGVVQLDSK
jgi:class 3 adenylate cyclase